MFFIKLTTLQVANKQRPSKEQIMDSLRLILVLAGAVVIVAVYLYSRYRKDSPREFRGSGYQQEESSLNSTSTNAAVVTGSINESRDEDGKAVIVDPSVYSCEPQSSDAEDSIYEEYNGFDDELSELGHNIKIEENSSVQDASLQAEDGIDLSFESSESGRHDKDSLVEKVMVIYLLAQPDQEFIGTEIVSVAEAEGLKFGEDRYYHRYSNQNGTAESVFGVANILEPGLFDLSDIDNLFSPGLVFFQRLSNAGGALEAFDNMLETVISFRDRLDGRLQDSGRRPLNKSAMIKLREQVVEFSLKNPVTPF